MYVLVALLSIFGTKNIFTEDYPNKLNSIEQTNTYKMKKINQIIVIIIVLITMAACSGKDRYTIASRLVYQSDSEEIWAVVTSDTNLMMFAKSNDSLSLFRCLHFRKENYSDFINKFQDNTLDWKTLDTKNGYFSVNTFEAEIQTKDVFDFDKQYSLSLPNTITLDNVQYPISYIGEAFAGWTGLVSIEIPNSVIRIGGFGFSDCIGLEHITVRSGNPVFDSRENCNAIILTNTNELVSGCKNTIIPNSVTSIGEWAFHGCMGLSSISIPNSVTIIGDYAFYKCTELASINIPNSMESIGNSAFEGCKALTSIEIPNSVTSIGSCAFENCESLTSANIPNSMTSIERNMFEGCTKLTAMEIPQSIKSIGESAFEGCESLWSIIIPNSVKEIGRDAFENCTGLAYLEIPNSVTSIGNGAFQGCKGLASIQIPNSVTSIGMCAFYDCSNVTSVDIPQSIKEINCDGSIGIMGTSLGIFDRSIRLVEQLQGTWEWSGYIYGSKEWGRLEVSDGQIVAYSSNGIIDQGSFNLDWDNNTIHFGAYSYLDFRFNFYSGWEGLTLYFDKKNGEKFRKISNYSSYNDNSYSYNTGGSSINARFTNDTDVINYTSSHTFKNNAGNSIKINFQGMYVNGSLLTNAPRVLNFNGSTATISVSSPYTGGGAMIISVDASRGTIIDGSGDVFWMVN